MIPLTSFKKSLSYSIDKNDLFSLSVFDRIYSLKKKNLVIHILNQLYGISYYSNCLICLKSGIHIYSLIVDLYLLNYLKFLEYFLSNYVITPNLQKSLENFFLLRYQFFSNYKGFRHLHGLPVNGQRTRSNAKSSRSLVFHNKLLKLLKISGLNRKN